MLSQSSVFCGGESFTSGLILEKQNVQRGAFFFSCISGLSPRTSALNPLPSAASVSDVEIHRARRPASRWPCKCQLRLPIGRMLTVSSWKLTRAIHPPHHHLPCVTSRRPHNESLVVGKAEPGWLFAVQGSNSSRRSF